jgi:hypothetical protein
MATEDIKILQDYINQSDAAIKAAEKLFPELLLHPILTEYLKMDKWPLRFPQQLVLKIKEKREELQRYANCEHEDVETRLDGISPIGKHYHTICRKCYKIISRTIE